MAVPFAKHCSSESRNLHDLSRYRFRKTNATMRSNLPKNGVGVYRAVCRTAVSSNVGRQPKGCAKTDYSRAAGHAALDLEVRADPRAIRTASIVSVYAGRSRKEGPGSSRSQFVAVADSDWKRWRMGLFGDKRAAKDCRVCPAPLPPLWYES